MDSLLQTLLSFPPHPLPPSPITDKQYDEGIKAHVQRLRKLNTRQLLQLTSGGEHLLNIIDPSLNSVSFSFVLVATIAAFRKDADTISNELLWQNITSFLERFDPKQTRYIGPELSLVIESAAEIAVMLQAPGMAIVPISSAILRLDPEGSTFTSNHLLLARLALESNRGGLATAVLDRPILYFPGGTAHSQLQYLCSSDSIAANYITAESGLTSKIKSSDILEYFTLTGSIYIGLRKWSKALEALETAISYPNKDSSVSKIMVEAYKKWILVNLLLHGKSGILPSMTSSGAARSYHTLAKPYETIASLFDSAPASRLKQEADVGVDIWKMDGNTGLILHVLSAYQKFQIRNLANIYSSLSLAEINGLTVSAETGKPLTSTEAVEELVLSMISDGSLHATLIQDSDAPPVLTFNSTGPILSELEVQVQLAQSMLRLKSLADDVKSTDRRLTQEKEYLKWALKQKKTSQSHGAGGTPGAESGWINSHMGMVHDDDDDDDDEDLMGSGY